MKILITGANGFIGSYLASYFLREGEEVIASSRQFSSSSKKLLAKATMLQLDVLDKGTLSKFSVSADVIIHTATANDIISREVARGIELSATGTKNILEFAVRQNIPRVMVFSTLQVYGTELAGEVDENTALHFQNDYNLNHLFAEMYAELYARQGKLKTVSVRPSNVYGRILTDSFDRWNLVPGCFCKEAFESQTITIRSSGLQMRNFIDLQNLSRSVACILQHFPDNYECFNLVSSHTNSMLEVATKVKTIYEKMFDKTVQLNIMGAAPEKTNHFNISLQKLKHMGFTEDQNYTLESEIEQIFNYLTLK